MRYAECMEWISQAHDALRAAFNPELAKDIAAAAELRQAGVRRSTIDSLYPIDPFAHVESVRRLMHNDEFMALVHAPLSKIDIYAWAGGAPRSIAHEIGNLLTTVSSMDGSMSYSLSYKGAFSTVLYARPERLRYQPSRLVVSTLLPLSCALGCFARYPFASEGWEEDSREYFDFKAQQIRPELNKVLNLIKIYQPKVER